MRRGQVSKISSQHEKCQVGDMLWKKGSSQLDMCQVGNMQSNDSYLFYSGIQSFIHSIGPS